MQLTLSVLCVHFYKRKLMAMHAPSWLQTEGESLYVQRMLREPV